MLLITIWNGMIKNINPMEKRNLLSEKNVEIKWFMGYCYIHDKTSGEMKIKQSFKDYESAMFAIEHQIK